mmetsp:Transcript_30093/g.77636  ORF Transcript_30093/g.77636 Transcript_30093/m.77636 type:complete len:99 (+) Transcript_30093:396-692(+)
MKVAMKAASRALEAVEVLAVLKEEEVDAEEEGVARTLEVLKNRPHSRQLMCTVVAAMPTSLVNLLANFIALSPGSLGLGSNSPGPIESDRQYVLGAWC